MNHTHTTHMEFDAPLEQRTKTLVLHHYLCRWNHAKPYADTKDHLHPQHKHMRGIRLTAEKVCNIINNFKRKMCVDNNEWNYLIRTNPNVVREAFTWLQPSYVGWEELIDEVIPAAERRPFRLTDKLEASGGDRRKREAAAILSDALITCKADVPLVEVSGRRGPNLAPAYEYRVSTGEFSNHSTSEGRERQGKKNTAEQPPTYSQAVAPQDAPAPKKRRADPSGVQSMHTRSEVAAQLRGMGFEDTLDFAILDAVDACNCDVQAALEMLLAHSVVVQPQQQQQQRSAQAEFTSPAPRHGLFDPSKTRGKSPAKPVPSAFEQVATDASSTRQQVQAACDTVDQGRGGADKKERRKRKIAQYAETAKTQRVVAFMELVSSEDDLVESMDVELLKEINKRQRERITQRIKAREKTAKAKASEVDRKSTESKGGGKAKASKAKASDQQQPAAKKKRKQKQVLSSSDDDDDDNAYDIRDRVDDSVDRTLEGDEDGDEDDEPQLERDEEEPQQQQQQQRPEFRVRKIKRHRFTEGKWELEYQVLWEGSSKPTWEPEENLDEFQGLDEYIDTSSLRRDGYVGRCGNLDS